MLERNQKDRALTLVSAFLMPMLMILPVFAAVGIYPFGDKSLLIVDMHNEYIDYLAKMNETIRFSGSFLRSWNMGLGLNMLGLIAFYTSSPFNIIIMLLPVSVISEAVFAVTLLKLGACGLFFAVFARYVFPKADKGLHVAFSVAYALMGYNIAYSSNIMWLDGTAFLPLVLLGAERIIREGRYKAFFLSLLYVFFTSYYIGYMIGIFSFLYFTASFLSKAEAPWKESVRAYARTLPRFFGSAALAAGCCAFLLLPAFLNLKDGQNGMWTEAAGLKLKYPVVRLTAKLLPGVYDSLTDSGLPNIYCTVLAVMLCVLYFCAKGAPRREKYIFGGLLALVTLSFSCEFLDLAWHAFEVPTWFPARYSFICSFLILFLALRRICMFGSVSRRAVFASATALVILFTETAVNRFAFVSVENVVASILLVLSYALILILLKTGGSRAVSAMLIVFVCMEAFGGAAFTVLGMEKEFGYRNRSEYRAFMEAYGNAVTQVKASDSGIYRCEILGARNSNGAMSLGYNGISHYSTTTNQKLNKFLRDLGYNKGTENELRFSLSTPATNGLLGIKYIFSKNEVGNVYILRDKIGEIGIYENPAVFPLAFWAPAKALDFETGSKNPFELQNRLISALTGEEKDIFSPVSAVGPKLDNAERNVTVDYIKYARQIRNRLTAVEFEVQNPKSAEAFAFFPVYDGNFSRSEVFVNGIFTGRDFTYRANTIIPLGNARKSTLSIVSQGEGITVEAEYFASLDLEAAKKAAGTAARNQMRFTKFSDTTVEGSIQAPSDGILATTFPFDSGWSIKIDGQRVKAVPLADVFLAIPLSAGTHDITMRYLPPGFAAGLVITVLSACAAVLLFAGETRRSA